jgi:uncharacterized membrane protein
MLSLFILQCVTCNQQVQAGIFNDDFTGILLKFLLPMLGLSLLVLAYQRSASGTGPASQENEKAATEFKIVPIVVFSSLIGIGMGGFVDGILLHQILQWHQMISNTLPPDTLEYKNINMFWDGIFHTLTWSITLLGILLMWKTMKRKDLFFSNKVFYGGLIAGWGAFNLVDSIFNHYLFRFHNVRENVASPELYNAGFLVFAVLLLAIGWIMIRKAV